ncbi:MAG: thiamine pyrophosphate-dependent enzyme [Myxococcota bacterium]|nr:thiamine pyrophosphate-dependent enzyme [Myxococcota bacterium]
MSQALETRDDIPQLSKEELLHAYRVGVRSRCMEEHIVKLVSRGEVKFAIWGPGEEVHGTATALALSRLVTPKNFGIVPHYRSGSLCSMWCELNGVDDFSQTLLRQQFSKDTDPMSRGRQMVYHLDLSDIGILPVQSPVGMQLGKAAGYAKGFHLKGILNGLTIGVVGDGTTAEGDMHDAMNAASVWNLPFILMVTDNGVAISTNPDEGRGIKDFASYAQGFGIRHFSCDGTDFWDVYETTYQAAKYVQEHQKPILFHVHSLPRLNAHSSAADYSFDLNQPDPLIAFGQKLVELGYVSSEDVLRRHDRGASKDFFDHYDLGTIMSQENARIKELITQIRAEPDPPPESIFENIHAPFPDVDESQPGGPQTAITYGGAIRAAIDNIITHHNGAVWGQDIARLGGVMQATAGVASKHAERIFDAPLNEPLIMGTACGASLHEDLVIMPEIQFGDYALNAFHWFVHMGNLYCSTNGNSNFSVIMRPPTDPFGGGAMYHSMSLDGYFSPIPGLVILMPSTSWDVYGLLMTAADYKGPVIVLEPKAMYRMYLGQAFPGEPTDSKEIAALKRRVMRGEVPTIDPSLRVPFSKAALRREGSDVTIVSWGRAVGTCMAAAKELDAKGIEAEIWDLRTLVPPDLESVFKSVSKTGRLVVASEDRAFAGFVRSIQGAVVEKFPGVPTMALGQKNIPGIAQSLILEDATILSKQDVYEAVETLCNTKPNTGSSGWSFIPPRYFIS